MDVTTAVAYTTFITFGLTFAYTATVVVETKKGKRAAEKFRESLDEKIITLLGKTGKIAKAINALCKRGSDEVERDLIDPVTKPIIETKHKYDTLKTGERKIRRVSISKISPHLQKLLQKSRQSSKNRSKKFRKKLKRLQQEIQKQGKNEMEQSRDQDSDTGKSSTKKT